MATGYAYDNVRRCYILRMVDIIHKTWKQTWYLGNNKIIKYIYERKEGEKNQAGRRAHLAATATTTTSSTIAAIVTTSLFFI
jgi:hypothetical protein